MKTLKFVSILLSFLSLGGCSSGTQYLTNSAVSDKLADSGGLTRVEMERAAEKIAQKIAVHFKAHPSPDGVFVAILRTKNETSEQISTEIFENALVKALLVNKIFTLRTDKRENQLKEIKLSQMLGVDMDLGKLKSPNFFVRSTIDENMYKSDGDKIVEQILNVELVEVASLIVTVSEKEIYSKKAKSNSGVDW